MTPNSAGKTALGSQERIGEELSDWRKGDGDDAVAAKATPRRRAGARPSLEDESTGAVLERELLLVQPPAKPYRVVPVRRLFRIAVVLLVLGTLGAGAGFGVLQLRRSWQGHLDRLRGRIDELAAANATQAATMDGLREETEKELRARQAENRELAQLVQKTMGELQMTVERLRELRAEKDALEERYRQLRDENEQGSFGRFLERLVPRWLVGGSGTAAPASPQ